MINATTKIIPLHHKNNKKMNKKTYSAILFFKPGTLRPRKYKNISHVDRFIHNVCVKNNVYYINLYDQNTLNFEKRIWIKDFR